jgi:hypothetical protein
MIRYKYFIQRTILSLLFCGMFFLSGCATPKNIDQTFSFKFVPVKEYEKSKKIPLQIELLIPKSFSTYEGQQWDSAGVFRFPLGEILSENAKIMTKALFQKVNVVLGDKVEAVPHVQAILTPRAVSFRRSTVAVAFATQETAIAVEWKLTNLHNDIIWINTVEGIGKEVAGNMFTYKEHMHTRLQAAVDALFKNSFKSISASPEIKQYAAKVNNN